MALIMIGCGKQRSLPETSNKNKSVHQASVRDVEHTNENKFTDRVSVQDVDHARETFHELKPGMPVRQVFATLGLSFTNTLILGDGGTSAFRTYHILRGGCTLTAFWDFRTNGDGALRKATLETFGQEQVVGALP
jgi:hypothetical protein